MEVYYFLMRNYLLWIGRLVFSLCTKPLLLHPSIRGCILQSNLCSVFPSAGLPSPVKIVSNWNLAVLGRRGASGISQGLVPPCPVRKWISDLRILPCWLLLHFILLFTTIGKKSHLTCGVIKITKDCHSQIGKASDVSLLRPVQSF